MNGAAPLLSVVIPTHNRPQYLARAIESALRAAPGGEVEVVVVPNGHDESWKAVAEHYAVDDRIKWQHIRTAHACTARNFGITLATAKYIRFLDDDDYLLDDAASQIVELESGGYEVCSGRVASVDMDGTMLRILATPQTDDFVTATTQVTGMPLPVGNVFLKSSIEPFRWDERADRTQDNIWMYTLAGGKEWSWKQSDKIVGAWFHHDRGRISTTQLSRDLYPAAVPALEQLWANLRASNRVNTERRAGIAQALWWHIHLRFPHQPFYWNRIAKIAASIDASSRPDIALFRAPILRHVPPILMEWALYPERWAKGRLREVWGDPSHKPYVRSF